MDELRFQVVLDKDVERKVLGVVAFGDFETDDDTLGTAIYQDVATFFRDLILGRPLSLTFVAKELETFGTILAITLFLHRDLAIHQDTPAFLAATNLADHGIIGLAHIERDLSAFFKFIRQYLASAKNQKQALESVVGWVRDYIQEKRLPPSTQAKDLPRILDVGTDGFVLASYDGPNLLEGWEELFRQGHLRGVVIQSCEENRWRVIGARKSGYLSLDLGKAAEAFNEAERAMGEPAEWQVQGNWLLGPPGGTYLTVAALLKVMVRA